jgi:hypothetical protein
VTATPCIAADRIGEVLELPETDPRRVHVAGCARCGALL